MQLQILARSRLVQLGGAHSPLTRTLCHCLSIAAVCVSLSRELVRVLRFPPRYVCRPVEVSLFLLPRPFISRQLAWRQTAFEYSSVRPIARCQRILTIHYLQLSTHLL